MGKSFEKEVLEAHNEYRKLHNTVPVKWSKELAKNAQAWADHLAKEGKFEHAKPNQRKGQGENIAFTQGRSITGEGATKMWYDEVKDYDFTETPRHNPKCGHFTQVIWNDTSEIGAGIASKDGKYFVVARYSPPGNMLSKFPENIKPPAALNNLKNDIVDGVTEEENQKNINASNLKKSVDADIDGASSAQKIETSDSNVNVSVSQTGPTYHVNISFGGNPPSKQDVQDPGQIIDTQQKLNNKHEQDNNNELSIKSKIFNLLTLKTRKFREEPKSGPKLVCKTVEVSSYHMPVRRKDNQNKYIEMGKKYEITHYIYS